MSPVTKPIKIQVAFQGGGAKIYALIAAAKALKEFEDLGKIKVTRVGGSSAGAIVAALYANDFTCDSIRNCLKTFPEKLPSSIKPGRFILKSWIFKIPFIGDKILEKKLKEIFSDDLKIGDPKDKKLVITYSDLRWGEQKVAHDNENLIEVLLDSCRIPFAFGKKNTLRSTKYDGGITGNLPIDQLLKDKEIYGPVIAFSFSSKKNIIKSSYELLLQIINSSIDSSVNKLLESGNLFGIKLNGDGVNSILDFRKMAEILDPNNIETEHFFIDNYNITQTELNRFYNSGYEKLYIKNRLENLYEVIPSVKTSNSKHNWVVNYKYTNLDAVHIMQNKIQSYIMDKIGVDSYPVDKDNYFDAIQKPEIAISNYAFYTFPFFLSHLRHNFWGIIRYGNHRSVGVIVNEDTSLVDDYGETIKDLLSLHHYNPFVEAPVFLKKNHWVDDLIRAIHPLKGKLISSSGYLFNEIIPLMLLEANNSPSQAVYPQVSEVVHPLLSVGDEKINQIFSNLNEPLLSELNSTRVKLNIALLEKLKANNSKSSAILFDLAEYDTMNLLIKNQKLNYAIYKLNHYLEIPVGIGFSLPAFEKIQEQHWLELKEIAKNELIYAKNELRDIGIELNI